MKELIQSLVEATGPSVYETQVRELVELTVADSGPGLTKAERARLFTPFERLGAKHGPVAGTGLGLALSRQLAEAMGGSIEVESEAGQGATFRVRLPAG